MHFPLRREFLGSITKAAYRRQLAPIGTGVNWKQKNKKTKTKTKTKKTKGQAIRIPRALRNLLKVTTVK